MRVLPVVFPCRWALTWSIASTKEEDEASRHTGLEKWDAGSGLHAPQTLAMVILVDK